MYLIALKLGLSPNNNLGAKLKTSHKNDDMAHSFGPPIK